MARTATPKDETPKQKFIRLANIRASGAITHIRNLGMLVGSGYESNTEQHDKLFSRLHAELATAEKSVRDNKPPTRKAAIIL